MALAWLVSAVSAAENLETVKGRIREVSSSAHRVKIATEGGRILSLRVDQRSKLAWQGKAASLDEFKKGMRVRVTFEPRDGEKRVVSMTSAAVSAEEVRKEIRDALEAAKAYTFQQKEEYRKRLNRVLERTDERIAELQDQAARAGAEAKKQYAEQIEQLRHLRDKARKQAERVKSATPKAWEDLKSGIGSAFEDLRKAFEKAGKRFR
jgi:hypothetical protein